MRTTSRRCPSRSPGPGTGRGGRLPSGAPESPLLLRPGPAARGRRRPVRLRRAASDGPPVRTLCREARAREGWRYELPRGPWSIRTMQGVANPGAPGPGRSALTDPLVGLPNGGRAGRRHAHGADALGLQRLVLAASRSTASRVAAVRGGGGGRRRSGHRPAGRAPRGGAAASRRTVSGGSRGRCR